jgi:hypothetical protein
MQATQLNSIENSMVGTGINSQNDKNNNQASVTGMID